MTRLLGAIIYNWPLKLMAIALATLLYAGLVISQNAQTRPVSVQIQALNQPDGTIMIGSLGEVSEIRYLVRDQANVTITSANFSASVDLAGVQPGPQSQSIRVVVESADPRIQVLSATPAFVSVKLERIEPKTVPVVVIPGPVPDGLQVEPPVPAQKSAVVRGAASDIARVSAVRAIVPIDASGIDIDRDFTLAPVDELGERVRGVDVEPASIRITMIVIKDRTTATVPIVPTIVGNPNPGFEVAKVTASVQIVSLQGDAEDLANVANARTAPISVEGRTADFEASVAFDLPAGITAVTPLTVRVQVFIRPIAESRTFTTGIAVTGARPDRTYTLSVQQALLTIGGPPADLDRLDGASLALSADATGLDTGVHQITLAIQVPTGMRVVAISPVTVTVTIGVTAGPAPSAGG